MRIKTDLYTRIVLTVIAVVLTLHLVKDINFVGEANAAPQSFAAQTDGVIDVNIVQVDGKRVDNLPVKIKNSTAEKIPIVGESSGGGGIGATEIISIYENGKLNYPAKSYEKGSISSSDVPTYVITKKPSKYKDY